MIEADIEITVNGKRYRRRVETRLLLADFLRHELKLTGTHIGCEHGVCGACTVRIDGKLARSCLQFAVALDGAEITTVEGLADDQTADVLRQSFHRHHGLQCGFCTPGMLMVALDILESPGEIEDEEIRSALSTNLCRCTGYTNIVRAVQAAKKSLEADRCSET